MDDGVLIIILMYFEASHCGYAPLRLIQKGVETNHAMALKSMVCCVWRRSMVPLSSKPAGNNVPANAAMEIIIRNFFIAAMLADF